MPTLAIIKDLHLLEQTGSSLLARLVVVMHDELGLERMEEDLNRGVVPAIAFTARESG